MVTVHEGILPKRKWASSGPETYPTSDQSVLSGIMSSPHLHKQLSVLLFYMLTVSQKFSQNYSKHVSILKKQHQGKRHFSSVLQIQTEQNRMKRKVTNQMRTVPALYGLVTYVSSGVSWTGSSVNWGSKLSRSSSDSKGGRKGGRICFWFSCKKKTHRKNWCCMKRKRVWR